MDAVERPQFRVFEGTCVRPLRWPGGWGGAWSPGHGPVWCRGVPLACTPWMAPVWGASNRRRRWAVGHWTTEGRRSPSFLRLLLGRPRRAPVVAVRALRPGGLAVLQLGWGTPWCTGPVGRLAFACVRDRCHCAPLVGGAVWGVPPTPCVGLWSAAGSLGRVSVACRPPGSGPAADPGREVADDLDAPSAARSGLV